MIGVGERGLHKMMRVGGGGETCMAMMMRKTRGVSRLDADGGQRAMTKIDIAKGRIERSEQRASLAGTGGEKTSHAGKHAGTAMGSTKARIDVIAVVDSEPRQRRQK